MATLSRRAARRLALARAGLLNPRWTGLPARPRGRGRAAAHSIVRRFGYLQLDTVAVAGARSHVLVLLSRLPGFDPALGEELLRPGAPLFEYWGHEASWMPMELYPAFEFRRRDYRAHPWWGDLVGAHPEIADRLRRRIREEGPLRSVDMEGASGRGWWDLKLAKKVATALWSSGELAIRERRSFQRSYDLAERVIPEEVRRSPLPRREGLERLLLTALDGHGWSTTGTLARTWRLRNQRVELESILDDLVAREVVVRCELQTPGGRATPGWIRPADLELADRLLRVRPRADVGVLLSPFDPVLWDRGRVEMLFGFHQVLEIFKRAAERTYGYFCLPVLAGDRLVARFDLKADRAGGSLQILSGHFERDEGGADREASRVALARLASALHLELAGDVP